MLKNKYKRFLIFSLCIIFIIMSIFSGIMANNTLHTDNCNIPDCPTCAFINIASDFMRGIALICVYLLILTINIYILQIIIKQINKTRTLTLVELKVIQNK